MTVDLGELNEFFNDYINLAGKSLKLDMAHGANPPSQYTSVKLTMTVLEDFDEDSYLNNVTGILKKNDVK